MGSAVHAYSSATQKPEQRLPLRPKIKPEWYFLFMFQKLV
jgi:quinol-cytochrome oxidoreductase complex cytochrome b subunit